MAHILIVEDQESIQFLIRTILESAHHSVSQANDGGAALHLLDTGSEPVELIIFDIFMPKMDGFEFLLILQKQPIRPPVVILSTLSEKIPHIFERMVSGRICKPFRRKELNDTVNRMLNNARV